MSFEYFNALINRCCENKEEFFRKCNLENARKDEAIPMSQKCSMLLFAKNVLNEMKGLQKIACINGIDIIFLKGYIQSVDLYHNIYNRPLSDIDVLVRPKDLIKLALLYKHEGYMFSDGNEITERRINEQLSISAGYHLSPIKKFENGIGISIELHFALDTSWLATQQINEEIVECVFRCAQSYKIQDSTFLIPCVEDRLIFSLQHISRHLLGNVANIFLPESKSVFNLKTLYDAALIQQKYSEVLNIDFLISRVYLYNFKYELLVGNKLLQILFGSSLINDHELLKIEDDKKRYWQNKIFSIIYNHLTTEDILVGTNDDFVKKITNLCIGDNIQYICRREYSDSPIVLDEYANGFTKERFGTTCRNNLVPKSSDDCRAICNVKWDEYHLYFDIQVYSKTVHYYCEQTPEFYGDSFVIAIYDSNYTERKDSVTGIHIIPSRNHGDKVKLNFEYCGEWYDPKVKDKRSVPIHADDYTIATHENGYHIVLKINWDILNINLQNTNYLGMELVINNVIPNTTELKYILAWSNVSPNYYNPMKFGKVFLTD